jgi:hypothetical protein
MRWQIAELVDQTAQHRGWAAVFPMRRQPRDDLQDATERGRAWPSVWQCWLNIPQSFKLLVGFPQFVACTLLLRVVTSWHGLIKRRSGGRMRASRVYEKLG